VNDPAGLIDIAPTVLDFLHLPIPASFEGTSLLGQTSGRAIYGESIHAHDAFGWSPLRSLRMGEFKYIEAPKPELYNLRTDPQEKTNLYVKGSAKAAALRNQMAKLLARNPPKAENPAKPATPGAQALLSSLGYLSPGPRAANAGSQADPKDRLPEFRMYEDAQLQLYHRQMTQALTTLRQLLARDPNNLMARRDLGSTYVETGDFAKSREAFLQVLRVAPEDYMTNYEIGIDEDRLGMLPEAKGHLEAACRLAPESKQARLELDQVQKKLAAR